MHQTAARKRPGNQWDDDLGQLVPVQQPPDPKPCGQLKLAPFFSAEYVSLMVVLLEDHFGTGGTAEEFVTQVIVPEQREVGVATMRRFSDLLLMAKKPKLAIEVMRWRSGESVMNDGRTISDIARAHHVRKQAVQQFARKLDKIVPFRSITRRSEESREKMRMRNARKFQCSS